MIAELEADLISGAVTALRRRADRQRGSRRGLDGHDRARRCHPVR